MARMARQYARRGIGLLPLLVMVGLAGCVEGRHYSIADSANPGSAKAAEIQDDTGGDQSGTGNARTGSRGRFRRFVFRSGADGLEMVAQSAALQSDTTLATTATPRYLAGNLVAANLTTTVNGGGMAGLTAAVPLAAVDVALVGGVLTGATSNNLPGSNLLANNLLIASFSTQSVQTPVSNTGGTVSVGGGSTSGAGSSGSTGTAGGTAGGGIGSAGGGVTPPITGTGTTSGTGTAGSVIGSVTPTITPSGVTGKGISGISGVTAPVLPH